MPDDATVNDHLGDAYWRVGRKTEARYQWERALNFKPEKEMVDQLHDKITNGMPAFVMPAEMAKKPQATAAGTPTTTPIIQVQ
ncbi:MAG: tetratricopeptide repeat protein, partial [Rickettsiales bacterium]